MRILVKARYGIAELVQPSPNEVTAAISLTPEPARIRWPVMTDDEWNRSHNDLVLHYILPLVGSRLSEKTKRLVVEAYLTRIRYGITQPEQPPESTLEQECCDGSSVVPDLSMPFRFARTKDWPSMPHDYGYVLHHAGATDCFGHKWGLYELHWAYRECWLANGQPIIGNIWWAGLALFGWIPWISGNAHAKWSNPK